MSSCRPSSTAGASGDGGGEGGGRCGGSIGGGSIAAKAWFGRRTSWCECERSARSGDARPCHRRCRTRVDLRSGGFCVRREHAACAHWRRVPRRSVHWRMVVPETTYHQHFRLVRADAGLAKFWFCVSAVVTMHACTLALNYSIFRALRATTHTLWPECAAGLRAVRRSRRARRSSSSSAATRSPPPGRRRRRAGGCTGAAAGRARRAARRSTRSRPGTRGTA